MELKNNISWVLFLIVLISFGFDYPAVYESNNNHHLFRIGRSRDVNEIMYDINLTKEGKPDKSNPITIYWIKRTGNGRLEPLTWIQKKYAYGIKYLDINSPETYNDSGSEINFQFVSYDKRTFTLKKDEKGQYKVFTLSQNKEIKITRIFVQIDGGSFWMPYISSVELYGLDNLNNIIVIETIHP